MAKASSTLHLPSGEPLRLTSMGRGVRSYWVGFGRPSADQVAKGDFTCPEVTHHYVTKSALVAAIQDGSAWLAPAAEENVRG